MAALKDEKLSPPSCAAVLRLWMKEELGLAPGTTRFLDIDSRLWIEFGDIRCVEPSEIAPFTHLRCILSSRVPTDLDAPFNLNATLVVTLYSRNPTPQTVIVGNVTETTRPAGGYTVAITETRGFLIAKTAMITPSGWGETLVWPFAD